MSSTATALQAAGGLNRRQLEEAFCLRLTDDCLRIAAGSNFDAKLLWKQRDAYIDALAKNGLSYDVIETVTND